MKKLSYTLAALSCLTLLTLSLGCASSGERPETALTRADVLTALEITAALTIGNDYKKAQTAIRMVRDARRYINEGEALTAGDLLDYIAKQALRSTSLTPAEQIGVRAFMDRYRQNFRIETESVGLSPEAVVTVSEALLAIESIAVEIQTYGSAAPRSYSIIRDQAPAQ